MSPLDWTADPPGTSPGPELRAFRTLLLAHLAVQAWAWFLVPLPEPFPFPPELIGTLAWLLTMLCGLSLGRHGRLATAIAAPVALFFAAWIFPATANHTGLVAGLVVLCTFLDTEGDDGTLLLQSLRWVAVIVFFWAGVQKLLHGFYFEGEFLAWMVGQGSERWAAIFGWMIPAEEVARLRTYDRYAFGGGPYRVAAPLFVLASNAVWAAEIGLAGGLLWRRVRTFAALAAIALVVLIQSAPREWMFALLYAQLLLLAVPGHWNRRLLPLFLAAYAYLVLVLLGAPGGWLLRAGGHV